MQVSASCCTAPYKVYILSGLEATVSLQLLEQDIHGDDVQNKTQVLMPAARISITLGQMNATFVKWNEILHEA